MTSKKLFNKFISKTTAFILLGATVVGSSMNIYAQEIPQRETNCTVEIECLENESLAGECEQLDLERNRNWSPQYGNIIMGGTYNPADCNPEINWNPENNCEVDNSWNPGENCEVDNSWKPGADSKPDTDNKPGTDSKPDTDNKPGGDNKPDIDNKPGTDSKPDTDNKPGIEVNKQTQFENEVLELVNRERSKAGLNPLQMDESVRNVARVKSSDMRKNNYFDHNSPTYGSPFDMLKQFGISYRSAGENIAQGYSTPQAVVTGWMNSPGHRANILNSSFTHIGVGYDQSGNYWTQLFIGK